MAQIVAMPKFGQMTEESTVLRWHRKEGETIRKGEVLLEIETDKAVLEVESFHEGTVLKIVVREGETVPVSAPLAVVGQPGEPIPPIPVIAPPPKAEALSATPIAAAPRATGRRPQSPAPSTPTAAPALAAPPRAVSPRAKALLREHAVNPDNIRGTGPGGRVVEKDVRDYLAAVGYDRIRISPSARKLALNEGVDITAIRGTGAQGRIMVRDVELALAERPKPLSRMRLLIAQRLTQSFTTTPHFYVTVSADLTGLLALKKELTARKVEYSVTDFVMMAVTLALKEFPVVNSVTDGRTARWHSRVHLGLAVSLDDGLVVPVIRDADEKSLPELRDAAADFAARARTGKLLPDEMTGSTFTISNMGMLDVENFTAIINPGEGAILAVATGRETPMAIKGRIEIRTLMKMTLSADHRLIDGAVAARFIHAIKDKLEDMELWKSLTS